MPFRHCICLLLLNGCALSAWGAETGEPAPRNGEPKVENKVAEDDQVRIEELRVRGETQRITVRSKLPGVRAYEIVPANGGRDLSQDKRSAGQRVWSILSF